MPTPIATLFTSYVFTPEEEADAKLLPYLVKCKLQNMMCNAATEKVNLTFDPTAPNVFLQREAALTGIIWQLQTLIDESDSREQEIALRK